MTLIMQMRGALEGFELAEDFNDTAIRLNNAAAQGREFMATIDAHGRNILVKMDNILTVVELDDDDHDIRNGVIA